MFTSLDLSTPPLDRVENAFLREHDVVLNVLRLDQIHPRIHGNKWYKLKFNIEHMQASGFDTALSFGGAYSNHLAALAAAGHHAGLRTIGIVRGELVQPLNPVLAFAQEQGMELVPISRSDYRRKDDPVLIQQLQQRFGEFYLIPEGGSNALAVQGCEEIAQQVHWHSDSRPRILALACGTGTTMAGLIQGLGKISQGSSNDLLPKVLGIAVLNAPGYLQGEVQRWLAGAIQPDSCLPPWTLLDDYHGGGYAKIPPVLCEFMEKFAQFSAIPIEGVYTGKLFFGLFEQIRQGGISQGSEIIALHTGGIHS